MLQEQISKEFNLVSPSIGGRYICMNVFCLEKLGETLTERLGSAWEYIFYMMGENYAKELIDMLAKLVTVPRPKEIIQTLTNHVMEAGWGHFKIEVLHREFRTGVKVQNNAFAKLNGGCQFLRGALKGIADVLSPQSKHEVVETNHSKPDSYYVFEILKVN